MKDNANAQNSDILGDFNANFKSIKNNDFFDFNAPKISENTINSQASQKRQIKIEMPKFDADLKFSQNTSTNPTLHGLSGLRGFNSKTHENPKNKMQFANIIQKKKAAQITSDTEFAKNNKIESKNDKKDSNKKSIENLLQNAKQKLKERRESANAQTSKNINKSANSQINAPQETPAQATKTQILAEQNKSTLTKAQTNLNNSEKNELNFVFNEISNTQNPQNPQNPQDLSHTAHFSSMQNPQNFSHNAENFTNSMNFDFNEIETKPQNMGSFESFAKEERELPAHFVLLAIIALLVCLALFLPKIFVRNKIYYASRDIIAAQAQLDSLREENIFIKRELENIKFKNLTHEFK